MSLEPSFHQLYRRSRYSTVLTENNESTAVRQNRAEIFAVASLGFAFRHELKFLHHFLCNVCQLSDVAFARGCEIRCQDGHQSDLAIVWPGQRAIVVEAKISADLQPHQNPTMGAFQISPTGYGPQIRAKYSKEFKRYYVVLTRDVAAIPKGDSECSDPQFLGFRHWGELEDAKHQTAFITDFLDSMGALGVPELQLRSFKGMKLEKETKSAANMFCLLEGLANRFQLARKDRWDVGSRSGETHYVGINIPAGGAFGTLSACVGSGVQVVGWFGYEAPEKSSARVSIWFYPQDLKALSETEAFIESRLKNVSMKRARADLSLFITRETESDVDDRSWFQQILDCLRDR